MPIHLHIGTHKTGTTAIQRQLERNRERLKRHGIWYPTLGELLPGRGHRIPHRNIARSLNNNSAPKPYSDEELQGIVRALLQRSQHYDHTILSAEAFWRIGFPARPEHCGTEVLWERKGSNVARIRQLFGDADVRITAVLRERSSYIQSSYNEYIIATLYSKGIKSYIRAHSFSWDYLRQLNIWGRLFPVSAYGYEQLCESNQLPLCFLRRLCGRELPEEIFAPDPMTRVNISQPLASVAFKRYLNTLPLDHSQRVKIYQKYSRTLRRSALKPNVQKLLQLNSWLKADALRDLQRSLAPGDRQIRQQLCPDLVSHPPGRWTFRGLAQPPLRPMTDQDEQQVIGWMLTHKPLKRDWFVPNASGD